MNKKTLSSLFAEAIYQIPDYQRGYAWEEKQWKDFIQDVDALVDDQVTSHYSGTIVVYSPRNPTIIDYGTKRLRLVDIVDGQQRLTTSSLYLSIIIRALVAKGELDFEREIPDFLYSGATCKLKLNNDTSNLFYDLMKMGRANTLPRSPHEKRLINAYTRLQGHIDAQLKERGDKGVLYLKELCHAITQKLHFTFYEVEEENEIGMTFELMNSRGKDLSVLELLKNYLMHWIYRNELDPSERITMTALVNKNWKDAYTNIGSCSGNEDQCLRIAWTLYCSHSPANWKGYAGFKDLEFIPLRTFTDKTKAEVKKFILKFIDGLAEISSHYSAIYSPNETNALSKNEFVWLSKIRQTGNLANFYPLIVAARKHRAAKEITENDYISLLKALECFAYRVYLYAGARTNAGKSKFHLWGYELFRVPKQLPSITKGIYALINYYAPEKSFIESLSKPGDWYARRSRLKYTLFEYELHLLETQGKGKPPSLAWKDLSDSTIEHILPQTPKDDSHWRKVWSAEDFKMCLHDIANLVLTQNNSNYQNFDFEQKKDQQGQNPCYRKSDIRQERNLADFNDWTRAEFEQRREELTNWISSHWRTEDIAGASILEVVDEDDEDSVPAPVERLAA